ncbi:MAG: hypothetical protein GY910_28595 [bacterium]|nr:hypothetical protein [Deltaproteobacteria bacterium]MCP4908956.1 hypothetical protein [bacterium]
MSGNFDYGSFGREGQDFTFFVQTRNNWSDLRKGSVQNGYLIDAGELIRIKSGEGRDTYELEDEFDRMHSLRGNTAQLLPDGCRHPRRRRVA